MPYCVPIKDMKDTASFTELVKNSDHPVFVTKNGREEFVVMSTEVFEETTSDPKRNAFYAMIDRSLDDARNGRVMDAFEFAEKVKQRYGL